MLMAVPLVLLTFQQPNFPGFCEPVYTVRQQVTIMFPPRFAYLSITLLVLKQPDVVEF